MVASANENNPIQPGNGCPNKYGKQIAQRRYRPEKDEGIANISLLQDLQRIED